MNVISDKHHTFYFIHIKIFKNLQKSITLNYLDKFIVKK